MPACCCALVTSLAVAVLATGCNEELPLLPTDTVHDAAVDVADGAADIAEDPSADAARDVAMDSARDTRVEPDTIVAPDTPTDASADAELCTPGTTRPAGDGCNTCTCVAGGMWACTLMACDPPECTPGEQGGECGQCVCTDDGRWVCDTVECPECTPGEAIGTGCDRCVCGDDGHWHCDLEPGCLGCTPGSERPAEDGCNTCVCTDDRTWACTEMACGTECNTDLDCMVTGCSGQVCAAEPTFTTCEFLPWYACYAPEITTCGCQAGRCGWNPTPALAECLEESRP